MSTSLCENSRCSSPKEIVPDIINFILVLDVIVVLEFSNHNVFIGDLYCVPG